MRRTWVRRSAIGLAAWLPFFVLWTAVALSFPQTSARVAIPGGLITTGTAGALGIFVWFACKRWPWPLQFRIGFYTLQIGLAILYGIAWTAAIVALEVLRGASGVSALMTVPALSRQTLLGIWFYAVFAGISYAVQNRERLHEKETL